MRPSPCLCALALLLAGCDMHSNSATKDGGEVHIHMAKDDDGSGGRMAVNVPGLDAKIAVPGFMMNGHMDIEGLKLAPDTQVKTVDVLDEDRKGAKDDGNVHITFTNPGPPAALLAYYRNAATNAGFTISPISGDSGLAATKGDKKVIIALSPEGGGSRGAIDVTGGS